MANIEVKNVRVADPGIGFDLTIDPAPNKTTTITVTLKDPGGNAHTSCIALENMSETDVVLIIPFGDSTYRNGSFLQFTITVVVEGETSQRFNGMAVAASKPFKFALDGPTAVANGKTLAYRETISSSDGNYIGVMRADGNFGVYPKSQLNIQNLAPVDESGTGRDGVAEAHLSVKGGIISVYSNGILLAQSENPDMAEAALVINEEGRICLQQEEGVPVPVSPWRKPT